jgi:hypothetical protein
MLISGRPLLLFLVDREMLVVGLVMVMFVM